MNRNGRAIAGALLILLVIVPAWLPARSLALEPALFKDAVRTGTISSPDITETSGIFASRTNKSVLWVVNDSGNPAALYALTYRGKHLGTFFLKEKDGRAVKNTDWEDLSGFEYRGEHFLVIADVGDNRARRRFCSLLIVREPSLGQDAAAADGADGTLAVRWQMRFQYENGPRDCESVAVDIRSKKILLLSKRTRPPVLYELPLALSTRDTLYTARPVAEITTIPPPTALDLKKKYGRYRSRPTSMDLSADGRSLVVLTYKDAYLFRRDTGLTWQTVLADPPRVIRLPHPDTGELVQREAVCFDPGTGRLIVTSEKPSAPIYTLSPAD